jgi:hypothetical protein
MEETSFEETAFEEAAFQIVADAPEGPGDGNTGLSLGLGLKVQ